MASVTAALVLKPTLLDAPVSNHGARVRYIIYSKGLAPAIDIASPLAYGGLRSPQYLALNPLGKMPVLLMPDGWSIPESEVISTYLIDRYQDHAPAFMAETPELRARAALITRILDLYIGTVQQCMYRKMDSAEARSRDIQQLSKQLNNLEAQAVEGGPYLVGAQVTGADASVLPTMVFMDFMLPTHFGWKDGVFAGRPKLGAWWHHMTTKDQHAMKVVAEIRGELQQWEASARWKNLGIDAHVADHPELPWC